MPIREVTYRVANRGLATSYTESELPPEYAAQFRNRVINLSGAAEKRQGISRLGSAIPGSPTVTGLHEHVGKDGSATLLASASGKVYRYDGSSWTEVYSGFTSTDRLRSVQMGDRLIFFNGVDRNTYTDDGGTSWRELVALIEQGEANSPTTTSLNDADITDWFTQTDVVSGDIIYNATREGYGIITAMATASVTHTAIGSGATGLGKTFSNPAAGDRYQIIDLVELNIIPTLDPNAPDNVGTAASGSSVTTITVSGVNFSTTDIRAGDFVHNTTRAAVMKVEAVATALTVTSVASQTAGDSLVFYKSAMPITSEAVVHYNRLYMVDARDKRRVRISGANDPQDLSTDGGTLDAITFNFDLQSRGDTLVGLGAFQRFLVLAGRKAVYLYEGTTPLGDGADFRVIGAFPQGAVSRFGLADIGNDLLYVTDSGVQSVRLIVDANAVNREPISEPIRTTLIERVEATSEDDIHAVHYPRRSWCLVKIGTEIYNYNYAPTADDPRNPNPYGGTWSLFDGPLAQQSCFLVRQNGDLVLGGTEGLVYEFDKGVYSDDGQAIPTTYQTGWLSMENPRSSSVRLKEGKYIKPLLQGDPSIVFTLQAEGGYEAQGNGSGTITATGATAPIGNFTIGTDVIGEGSSVTNTKIPFRWRGEVMRYTVTTEHTTGPDIIGRYTLYTILTGRR